MVGPINADNYSGLPYLKGNDVPAGQQEVSFRVLQFVVPKTQLSGSKLTAEISETHGKRYWGLNSTAITALKQLGYSDLQTLCGKTVKCMIGFQPNPQQNNQPTRSLFVVAVE